MVGGTLCALLWWRTSSCAQVWLRMCILMCPGVMEDSNCLHALDGVTEDSLCALMWWRVVCPGRVWQRVVCVPRSGVTEESLRAQVGCMWQRRVCVPGSGVTEGESLCAQVGCDRGEFVCPHRMWQRRVCVPTAGVTEELTGFLCLGWVWQIPGVPWYFYNSALELNLWIWNNSGIFHLVMWMGIDLHFHHWGMEWHGLELKLKSKISSNSTTLQV